MFITATQNPTNGAEGETRPEAGPTLLTASEFPALGASASATTEKKSKAKEASKKDGSASVFRERHYAQQREVHGGNMRALDAMEEGEENLKSRRRNRDMDPEWINSVAESAIRDIASEGELVTKEKVPFLFFFFRPN